VPPAVTSWLHYLVGDARELVCRHLGKAVEVDNGPAARLTITDDVAARRLTVLLAVQTVTEVYGCRVGPERR
jgi:hypothetical protein